MTVEELEKRNRGPQQGLSAEKLLAAAGEFYDSVEYDAPPKDALKTTQAAAEAANE